MAETMHDGRLLREYAEHGSQAAFARLVERYLRLVYSACLRETGEAGPAEDAAQAVFLLLARKAPSLQGRASLAGWLFAAARLVSRNAARQERRRRRQEQKAMEERTRADRDAEADAAVWGVIEPSLNDALAALNGREREAVLLRFFQGLSLAETGAALGVSADAAQMRVSRAVDNLRRHLAKAGVGVSGAALATLLPAHAAHSLPAGGAAKVVASLPLAGPGALGAAGANVYGLYQGAVKAMWMTNVKIGAAFAVAALALAGAIPLMAHVHPPRAGVMAVSRKPAARVLGVVQAPAFDPKAQKLLRQMAAAYQGLSSYSDTTEMVIANGPKAVAALNASTPPLLRATVAVQKPDRVAVRAAGMITGGLPAAGISDGKTYWELRPSSQDYLAQPVPPRVLESAFSAGSRVLGSTLLQSLLTSPDPLPGWLHGATAIKMGRPVVVSGVPVQTVIVIKAPVHHDPARAGVGRGEGQTGDTPPFTDQTKLFLSIGVKDHLLRRLSWVNTLLSPGIDRFPGGTVTLVQMETHRNVKADPALAASTWAFTPPPGFMLGDVAVQAAPLKTPPLTPPAR